MQLSLLVLPFVIGVCQGVLVKPDTFITSHSWYYLVVHRTCGFIHCDLVYKCSIEASSVRTGQYNCTRSDHRIQSYQVYNVLSQENGLYCEDVTNSIDPHTGASIMKAKCCRDLIGCNQFDKREQELAVTQQGLYLEQDNKQEHPQARYDSGRFAVELYQMLVQLYPYDNVMLCPVCVMNSLKLLRSGSSGVTRQQITQVLGTNSTFNQKTETKSDDRRRSTVFYDKDRKLNPKFKQAADTLGALTTPLPFSVNALRASSLIDNWLQNNTDVSVVDAYETGNGNTGFNEDLVIASAMKFSGNWSTNFDPNRQTTEKFHSLDGSVYKVEMMNSGQPIKYRMKIEQGLQARVLEIPFIGSTVVMRLVIPDNIDGLPFIEDRLTHNVLKELETNLELKDVNLTLPQIRHSYHKNLERALSHMGADRLFKNADLSGIYEDRSRPPKIRRFIQATSIRLNEQFEASGAAVGSVEAIRVFPEQIMADRPFLFILEETLTKTYLLMGRIAH